MILLCIYSIYSYQPLQAHLFMVCTPTVELQILAFHLLSQMMWQANNDQATQRGASVGNNPTVGKRLYYFILQINPWLSNVVNIKTDIFDSCQFASKPYL